MSSSPNRRTAYAARRLAAVAGLAVPAFAMAQTHVYSGGGGDSNWATAANWDALPPAGGGPALLIRMGAATPANRAGTNQNRGDPFELQTLEFQAGGQAFTIAGSPLRFNVFSGASIVNDSNRVHSITAPIVLGTTGVGPPVGVLTFSGAANSASQVRVRGRVSPGASVDGSIVLDLAGGSSVALEDANTFTGGVRVNRGTLAVGHNQALGTGPLTMSGGAVRSGSALDAVIGNAFNIQGSFQAGQNLVDKRLTINGAVSVTGGVHTITLPNSRAGLALGGAISSAATDGVKIQGGSAPTFRPARDGMLTVASTGSNITLSGASPDFRGSLEVIGATALLTGSLGAPAAGMVPARPVASVTIGDGVTRSAMISKRGAITLPAGADVTVKSGRNRDKAVLQLGTSPGTLTIYGGGLAMEPGADIAFSIDGLSPGDDDGQHSQLVITDGGVSLQSDGMGMLPVLHVGVGASYLPDIGTTYTIIDIQNSAVTPLDISGNLFMSPEGLTLFQGATWTADDNFTWNISYRGTSGLDNDVVLTLVSVPSPGSLALLLMGGLVCRRRRL